MSDQKQERDLTPVSIIAFSPLPFHYEAVANILAQIYPEHVFDAAGLQMQDEMLPAYCKHKRWIGCCGDAVVAFGEYRQTPEMYHPNRFTLNIAVRPEYQRKGIGSRLYQHLVAELRELNPGVLRTTIRADCQHSVTFLKKRNFACTMRVIEWWLDLSPPYKKALLPEFRKVKEEGIRIQSVEELSADPDRNRKLFQLISLLRQDVPLPDSATPVDYQQFIERFLEHPSYIPEAAFVAIKEGEYIGYSDLKADGDSNLYGGLTGVHRDHRRLGVATALKLQGIHYGRLQGYRTIKTFSASENLPIGRTNRTCGFVPQHEWMHLEQIYS